MLVRLIGLVKIRPRSREAVALQVGGSGFNGSALAVDSDNTLQATVIAEINDIAIFVRFVVALILMFHIRSVLLVYIGTQTIRQDRPGKSRSAWSYNLIQGNLLPFPA